MAGMTVTKIWEYEQHRSFALPLLLARVPAGFPSPADDYLDGKLDLNELLVK